MDFLSRAPIGTALAASITLAIAQAAFAQDGGYFAATQNETQSAEREEGGEDDLFKQALRVEAQRLLAEADMAFDDARYNEAQNKYATVVNAYSQHLEAGDIAHASERIDEITMLLAQPGARPLEETVQQRELVRQQVDAEFENLLSESETALRAGRVAAARNAAGEALLRLKQTSDVFGPAEYNQRADMQASLVSRIDATEETLRDQELLDRQRGLTEDAAERQAQEDNERVEKIANSILRARALQQEQKYEEALQVIEEVLFLDPNNPAGQLLKDLLNDTIVFRDYDRLQRDKKLSYANESLRVQEAMVAPKDFVNYPSDWPELSFRRLGGNSGAFYETPENRAIIARLENTPIAAGTEFADNTLDYFFQFLFGRILTDVNTDIDWASLERIGITKESSVSLRVAREISAMALLNRVLDKVSKSVLDGADIVDNIDDENNDHATWSAVDGILIVSTKEHLSRNVFVQVHPVNDLLFQVKSFDEVPNLDLGNIIRGGGGSSQVDASFDEPSVTRNQLIERLTNLLQDTIDPDAWESNGGVGSITSYDGNLVVTTTASNHREVHRLLGMLREVQAVQINVETRFLLVDKNFFEQIGFDIDVIFNANNSQTKAVQKLIDQFTPGDVPKGTNKVLPSELINAYFGGRKTNAGVLGVFDTDDDPDKTVLGVQAKNFLVPAPDGLSFVPASQDSLGLSKTLFNGSGFGNKILSANPALKVAATFLDDVQVDVLLEATQADRRSVSLTAPRITFIDNKSAVISVATQRSFISDLDPVVGTRSVAFDPQPGVVSSGFSLLVRGVVSNDRRYVTLEIQAAVAELVGLDNFQITAFTNDSGDDGGGSTPQTATLQQPRINNTQIKTGATIPDQGTLLLGGQRVATESQVETGVPVLSQIPVINRFFTNRIEDKFEQTLLILVKPTILVQNEEEEKNFPGLQDQLFGSGR